MAFGIGDSLSVRLSAQTTDFTRGMNRAERKLSDVRNAAFSTSGGLQLLQNRADEASDKMRNLGITTAFADSQLNDVTPSLRSFAGGLRAVSIVAIVSAIPALIALSSTLVPITASLGGVPLPVCSGQS